MDDRKGWRERVREIRADGATGWWWRWLKEVYSSLSDSKFTQVSTKYSSWTEIQKNRDYPDNTSSSSHFFPGFWEPFLGLQLPLESPSLSRSTAFSVFDFHSMLIFHTSFNRWFLQWTLSDNKSPHVSRTLLSILTDYVSAFQFLMISILPLIWSCPNLFPRPPNAVSITVTCMFPSIYDYFSER